MDVWYLFDFACESKEKQAAAKSMVEKAAISLGGRVKYEVRHQLKRSAVLLSLSLF